MPGSGRRRFNGEERAWIYAAAGGRCAECGAELSAGWHADHKEPYSCGGPTELKNAQALCPACNLKKGSMSAIWPRPPREWQQAAFNDYTSRLRTDYLAAVCPGGGKTQFALAVAKYLLEQGRINFVVVVSPTDSLTRQWADNAAAFGIPLNPEARAAAPFDQSRQYRGLSLTYHKLAKPGAAAALSTALQLRRVLVILDEAHHTGEDKAWGCATQTAFELCEHRLLLSGTPSRSDTARIPFARYEPAEDGAMRIVRDFEYGTGRGVRDGVIRRVDFRFYDGEVHELAFGERVPVSSNLSEAMTTDDHSKLMGVVMDPDSGWFADLLPEVHKELTGIRRTVPNAGCLILAYDKEQARSYARIVKRVTGADATLVLSDDPAARSALETFTTSTDPYLIAVRMVSEGVDVPRLRVLVWLTRTKTELFFAQGTARVVRIPDVRDSDPAVVFMPALRVLRELAQGIEDDLAHEIRLLEQEAGLAEGGAGGTAQGAASQTPPVCDGGTAADTEGVFGAGGFAQTSMMAPTISVDNIALQATLLGSDAHDVDAHLQAQEIIDGNGYPQTHVGLLRDLIARGIIPRPGTALGIEQLAPSPQQPQALAVFRLQDMLRKELNTLCKTLARQHYEDKFAWVRAQVNNHIGASAERATTTQLKAGIEYAKAWLERENSKAGARR